MAVSASIAVYTGSDLSTSSVHSGVVLMSSDQSASESGSRSAYPVATCSQSTTKWLKLFFGADPGSTVTGVKLFGDGATDPSTCLFIGATCTASPPSDNDSGIATSSFDTYTSACKLAWDPASITASGPIDTWAVLQLDALTAASPKDWSTETLIVQWQEGTGACRTFSGVANDGFINGSNATYSTARGTSVTADVSASYAYVGQLYTAASDHVLYRAYLDFDTSGIDDDDVLGASLFIAAEQDYSDDDFNLQVYRYAWAANLANTPTDRETHYDGAYGATASLEGTLRDVAAGWASGAFYSLEVATSGITTTGSTKYALVSSSDIAGTSSAGNEYVGVILADAAATASDPYMEILTTCQLTFTLDAKISKRLRRNF